MSLYYVQRFIFPRYPPSCEAFQSFLQSTHAFENLYFWLAVDRYESKANFIYQGGELSKTLLFKGSSIRVKRSTNSRSPVSPIQEERLVDSGDQEEDRALPASPSKRRQSVVTTGAVYDLAEDIVKRFILVDSPHQVNISGATRANIEENFKRWGASNEIPTTSVNVGHVLSNGSIVVNATESTKSIYTTPALSGIGVSGETFIELFADAKKEVVAALSYRALNCLL